MGTQVTVREMLRALQDAGFIPSLNYSNRGSHQHYIYRTDPARYADVSVHAMGQVIPKGTLKSIERTSGVIF
ncbi:type II toxin-antitoxin system HicA family toxin [Paenibacillus tritici]|nr:type II toxin-antitoxin system HicA family toxin [Paenibacillus tritici]